MKRLSFKQILSLLILILLLISLPFALQLVKQIQYYLIRALGQPAKIMVDASTDLGRVSPIWQALAQGGEEKYPFDSVMAETTALAPKYVRIDHLYDFYNVVEKTNNGQLTFNWTELDKQVNQIIKMGAKPFLSLSYMPPAIAQGGDITAAPTNWNDWSAVVRETIQHYSGRGGYNLSGVAYEIWNEPDLFGQWKISGQKDYRLLYRYAALGANQTKNTNSFKIGGPAITAPYKNWVDGFLDYTTQNNLRIDFYSWHRYSYKPEEFLQDIDKVDTWLFRNAGHSLEKFITEWGPDSENSAAYDNNFGAAHLVAIIRQLLQRVDLAFIFEIKDGPEPSGKKYWGRWGLLTHEKAGPVEKKPRYFSLRLLNQMTGNRLQLEGEGTWVTGFASKNTQGVKIILVNFDGTGKHFENIPVTIKNLEAGSYTYKETYLSGAGRKSNEAAIDNAIQKFVPLTANNVVLIELTKI